jgi:ABC-2 type transport system permease protein
MAWILVRLKLRLLRNGLRGNALRAIAFVLGCAYALAIGTAIAAGFLSLQHRVEDLEVVAELAAVGAVLGWSALPLLGFGSDETLDPSRLALLPLSRGEVIGGLLGAAVCGPAGAATAIGLAGATIALLPPSAGAVIVVVAAAAQLAMCAAMSRALVTALSAVLRSRRGRDLRIILIAVIAFAPEALRLAIGDRSFSDVSALRPWAHGLSWLPPVLPARSMIEARSGHWATAVLALAGGFLTLAAVLLWWSRSLEQVLTTAEAPPDTTTVTTRVTDTPLFDPWLGFLPRTRTGAVAARELRYTWREPRRRVQLISGVVVPFVLLGGVLSRGGLHHHKIVFAALLVAFLAGNNRAVNQIGLDGPAFWVHEAAGQDLRADLGGKNVAVGLVTFPLALTTALVLATISGGWGEFAVTAAVAAALVAMLLGVGDVASILVPLPSPESATNAWGTQAGQGCTTGLLSLLVLAVEAVLAAPIVLPALTLNGAAERAAVVTGAVAYGAIVYSGGLALAVRLGRTRGPELLERIGPRYST